MKPNVFLTADLHLGHKGVCQFMRRDGLTKLRPSCDFKWAHHAYDGKIGSVSVVDDIDNSVVVHFGDYESAWFLMSEVERIPDNPANGTTVQSAIDFLISQGYEVTISKKAN